MPKKKPIDKRLKNLFEDVKPEQAPAEFRPAPHKRALDQQPLQPAEVKPVTKARRPVEEASHTSPSDSSMSLVFQAGQDSWATFQVVDETQPRKWTQDEQLLVKQVADQLSLALENARLFQETQSRAEELTVLNEMARELSAKLEISAIAEVIYRYTGRLMDTSNFFFALYDEKTQEKSYPLAFEEGRQIQLGPSKVGDSGFSDYIIRNRRPVFAPNDVLEHMKALGIAFVPLDEDTTPSQCWLGVPMMIGARVLGLISVQNVQKPNLYDEHDRDILATIASQAAIAVENGRLFEEVQLRAEETARLNRLVTKVAESLDMQKNLQIIADEIADFTSALHVGIALIDTEQNDLVLSADAPLSGGKGDIGIRIPIVGNPTAEPVIESRQPLFLNDTFNHPATAAIADVLRTRGTQSLFIWPIIVGREVLGTLGIDFADPNYQLPENQKNLISTILFQTSTSIQNARLFHEARRRAQETAALAEVGREISVTLDLETVLTRIATYARDLFQAESSAVYLPDEGGATWRAISVVGAEAEEIKRDPINTGEDILGRVVLQKAGQIVNDASSQAGALIVKGTIERPHDHIMGVPILSGDRITGLMAVWRAGQGQEFSQAELEFLTSLARQAAIAIQNARLFKESETRADELAILNQLAQSLSSQLNVEQIIETIYKGIARLIDARNFYIGFYDESTNEIVFPQNVTESDLDRNIERLPMGQGITSYMIQTGKSILINDGSEKWMAERGIQVAGAPAKSFMGVPLSRGGKVLGAMAVQSYDQYNAYDRHDLQLLTAFASQVSVALENARLFQETQKSEAELRTLFASMNDVIIVYDRHGRYVRIAPTNPSLLVRPPEEMVGKYISEVLPAELNNQFMQAIHQALTTNEIVRVEYPLTIAGNLLWFDANVSKLNEDQVFWVARDITARKLSEEAIRESDARTRLILETAIDAFIAIDSHSVITEWNPQAAQIFGWTREEAVGRNLADLIIPETYRNAHRRGLKHYLATGEGPVLNQRIEIMGLHREGHLFPIELAISSIPIAGKSTFSAFVRDITERKRSEEAIRRQNEYLAVSAEIGRLVTSTLDLNTIFSRTVSLISERFGFYHSSIFIIEETGFNAVLREATGEAGEKMKVAKHSLAVGSGSIVGKAAESGEPVVVNNVEQEPLHRPNPLLLDTLSEAAIPLRIGPRIVGVIDIQSTQTNAFTPDDISVLQSLADQVAIAIDNARSYELSQQLINDLREIDLLKSQFLANMSHELRTPLNSIIGFSRVILKGIDGPVTEMQQQDLTAIYNSGQHLLGLINDILDLARIEAGKMELNFEEVHLAEMTTSVMSTAKGLVKEKPIQLLQRVPAEMPSVRGDAMRVRQVLLNLISNAAKFTEGGSITVETLVQRGPTGKAEALINVIDTGPGISTEDQKKLFQAFSQVDGSATRKSGGTGLGLSICANLVQLHGGRIGVHSEAGKGSTFWFTLPLYSQPEEQIPDGKKVVIAIDDDPQVIGLYERYLNPQGYYVLPISDPLRAKEQILKIKPFAITLDIMMPNKDGWSVLTDLKSDPATRDYPVIICSILEQADKGFSLGAADYLVKPILEEDLVHALDRLNKDGTIHEVLVIDDDPNDLRLIEKILTQNGRYKPILAQGGRNGWEAINQKAPHAIILDLFMPEMDGFNILEKLRQAPALRNIPVLVVSGGGLTNEQHQQLSAFGQRLIRKGSLNEMQLIESIENSLKQLGQ